MPLAGYPRLWSRVVCATGLTLGAVILMSSAVMTRLLDGSLDHWLLSTTLTIERLLPLIGLGICLGQWPARQMRMAVLLVLAGFLWGFFAHQWLMLFLAPLPGAPGHGFFAGPIACLATGAVLVLPQRRRAWPGALLLPVIGASLALAIRLADPSLHDWRYPPLAILLTLWLLIAVSTLVRKVKAPWTLIAARVFGSWLLAIGALYGGAYMATKEVALTPPPFLQPLGTPGEETGFETLLPILDGDGGKAQ